MTVSELNLIIADAILKEPRVRSVSVRGEVSGFRHHLASGHWYFQLKDEDSSISCVLFRQNTFHAKVKPVDGDSVTVTGYVDVYPRNGTYQLYVTSLRPAGMGDLYIRFEELKRRLNAEGLFDPARKRVIPMSPRKVAVVTSASGAAWQDILNVSAMRNPSIPIILIPVTVQGERAAAGIAAGIRDASLQTDADVLIVARGGGSAEDLWCFNEEAVVRAVAESRIPVVSGVGHEIDTTICDLAADIRASTPSNAAEIVFPDRKELRSRADGIRKGLMRAAEGRISASRTEIKAMMLQMTAASPERRVSRLVSGSRLCREQLAHAIRNRMDSASMQLPMIKRDLHNVAARKTDAAGTEIRRLREHLEAINPFRVLERGYSLVMDPDGRLVTNPKQAEEAENVTIRFAAGTVKAAVRRDGGQKK